jgi:hypothetical protein
MHNLVYCGADVDCDGIQYFWCRFEAPLSDVAFVEARTWGRDDSDIIRRAIEDERLKSGLGVGSHDGSLITEAEFLSTVYPQLDSFGKGYWQDEGYANSGGY